MKPMIDAMILAVEWGTVGEWISGIGALAAVLVALVIWIHDRKADSLRALHERAARVNVWYQAPGTGPERNNSYWLMTVQNESDLPVYEWEAAVWWQRSGPPPPGPHVETKAMSASNDGPLFPGAQLVTTLKWRDGFGDHFPQNPVQEFKVAMMWRDPGTKRWWLRYGAELYEASTRWPEPWLAREVPGKDLDLDGLARHVIRSHLPRRTTLWQKLGKPGN